MRELSAEFFFGRAAYFDEEVAILVAFFGEMDEEGAARGGFFFGEQTIVDHGFDGAVDDGAVEAELGGDLILVEGGAAAKSGEDEAARLGALGFLLELFADGKIGRGQVNEHGIVEDGRGDEFFVDADHRNITVSSKGLRHCGWST